MIVTWSNSNNESEDETKNTTTTFTSKWVSNCESSNGDLNEEELDAT